jgi:hypothetical protein
MLSPVLLGRLRVWWRVARAQGRMLDGWWLFPGLDPVDRRRSFDGVLYNIGMSGDDGPRTLK